MTHAIEKSPLYAQDLSLWYTNTIAKLKAGDFDTLDIEHLMKKIEGLAGRDRSEPENRLDALLPYLFKRLYVDKAAADRSWEWTIQEQQKRLRPLLKQSPSLKNDFVEVFDEVWQDALIDVQNAYPKTSFPAELPLSRSPDDLLTQELWTTEDNLRAEHSIKSDPRLHSFKDFVWEAGRENRTLN